MRGVNRRRNKPTSYFVSSNKISFKVPKKKKMALQSDPEDKEVPENRKNKRGSDCYLCDCLEVEINKLRKK